jgi:prevent-host-death family protein
MVILVERSDVMGQPKLRNRRGQPVKQFSATEAKNAFGQVLESAERDGIVAISRHDRPRAVVLSMEAYRELAGGADERLGKLEAEFDAMFEGMQAPGWEEAMQRGFDTPSRAVGPIAVKAARRKR